MRLKISKMDSLKLDESKTMWHGDINVKILKWFQFRSVY